MLKILTKIALPMLAVAATTAATLWTAPVEAKELRVLAWEGYADDDWVKEFEKQSGADVKVVFIGSDDEIWAKIKGSEGKDFDVFAVNTAPAAALHRRRPGAARSTSTRLPNQKDELPRLPRPLQGQGRDRATARSTAIPVLPSIPSGSSTTPTR